MIDDKEIWIDFSFAPFALVDILLMLDDNDIKSFSITQEDHDLHIRINKKHLRDISNRKHGLRCLNSMHKVDDTSSEVCIKVKE